MAQVLRGLKPACLWLRLLGSLHLFEVMAGFVAAVAASHSQAASPSRTQTRRMQPQHTLKCLRNSLSFALSRSHVHRAILASDLESFRERLYQCDCHHASGCVEVHVPSLVFALAEEDVEYKPVVAASSQATGAVPEFATHEPADSLPTEDGLSWCRSVSAVSEVKLESFLALSESLRAVPEAFADREPPPACSPPGAAQSAVVPWHSLAEGFTKLRELDAVSPGVAPQEPDEVDAVLSQAWLSRALQQPMCVDLVECTEDESAVLWQIVSDKRVGLLSCPDACASVKCHLVPGQVFFASAASLWSGSRVCLRLLGAAEGYVPCVSRKDMHNVIVKGLGQIPTGKIVEHAALCKLGEQRLDHLLSGSFLAKVTTNTKLQKVAIIQWSMRLAAPCCSIVAPSPQASLRLLLRGRL